MYSFLITNLTKSKRPLVSLRSSYRKLSRHPTNRKSDQQQNDDNNNNKNIHENHNHQTATSGPSNCNTERPTIFPRKGAPKLLVKSKRTYLHTSSVALAKNSKKKFNYPKYSAAFVNTEAKHLYKEALQQCKKIKDSQRKLTFKIIQRPQPPQDGAADELDLSAKNGSLFSTNRGQGKVRFNSKSNEFIINSPPENNKKQTSTSKRFRISQALSVETALREQADVAQKRLKQKEVYAIAKDQKPRDSSVMDYSGSVGKLKPFFAKKLTAQNVKQEDEIQPKPRPQIHKIDDNTRTLEDTPIKVSYPTGRLAQYVKNSMEYRPRQAPKNNEIPIDPNIGKLKPRFKTMLMAKAEPEAPKIVKIEKYVTNVWRHPTIYRYGRVRVAKQTKSKPVIQQKEEANIPSESCKVLATESGDQVVDKITSHPAALAQQREVTLKYPKRIWAEESKHIDIFEQCVKENNRSNFSAISDNLLDVKIKESHLINPEINSSGISQLQVHVSPNQHHAEVIEQQESVTQKTIAELANFMKKLKDFKDKTAMDKQPEILRIYQERSQSAGRLQEIKKIEEINKIALKKTLNAQSVRSQSEDKRKMVETNTENQEIVKDDKVDQAEEKIDPKSKFPWTKTATSSPNVETTTEQEVITKPPILEPITEPVRTKYKIAKPEKIGKPPITFQKIKSEKWFVEATNRKHVDVNAQKDHAPTRPPDRFKKILQEYQYQSYGSEDKRNIPTEEQQRGDKLVLAKNKLNEGLENKNNTEETKMEPQSHTFAKSHGMLQSPEEMELLEAIEQHEDKSPNEILSKSEEMNFRKSIEENEDKLRYLEASPKPNELQETTGKPKMDKAENDVKSNLGVEEGSSLKEPNSQLQQAIDEVVLHNLKSNDEQHFGVSQPEETVKATSNTTQLIKKETKPSALVEIPTAHFGNKQRLPPPPKIRNPDPKQKREKPKGPKDVVLPPRTPVDYPKKSSITPPKQQLISHVGQQNTSLMDLELEDTLHLKQEDAKTETHSVCRAKEEQPIKWPWPYRNAFQNSDTIIKDEPFAPEKIIDNPNIKWPWPYGISKKNIEEIKENRIEEDFEEKFPESAVGNAIHIIGVKKLTLTATRTNTAHNESDLDVLLTTSVGSKIETAVIHEDKRENTHEMKNEEFLSYETNINSTRSTEEKQALKMPSPRKNKLAPSKVEEKPIQKDVHEKPMATGRNKVKWPTPQDIWPKKKIGTKLSKQHVQKKISERMNDIDNNIVPKPRKYDMNKKIEKTEQDKMKNRKHLAEEDGTTKLHRNKRKILWPKIVYQNKEAASNSKKLADGGDIGTSQNKKLIDSQKNDKVAAEKTDLEINYINKIDDNKKEFTVGINYINKDQVKKQDTIIEQLSTSNESKTAEKKSEIKKTASLPLMRVVVNFTKSNNLNESSKKDTKESTTEKESGPSGNSPKMAQNENKNFMLTENSEDKQGVDNTKRDSALNVTPNTQKTRHFSTAGNRDKDLMKEFEKRAAKILKKVRRSTQLAADKSRKINVPKLDRSKFQSAHIDKKTAAIEIKCGSNFEIVKKGNEKENSSVETQIYDVFTKNMDEIKQRTFENLYDTLIDKVNEEEIKSLTKPVDVKEPSIIQSRHTKKEEETYSSGYNIKEDNVYYTSADKKNNNTTTRNTKTIEKDKESTIQSSKNKDEFVEKTSYGKDMLKIGKILKPNKQIGEEQPVAKKDIKQDVIKQSEGAKDEKEVQKSKQTTIPTANTTQQTLTFKENRQYPDSTTANDCKEAAKLDEKRNEIITTQLQNTNNATKTKLEKKQELQQKTYEPGKSRKVFVDKKNPSSEIVDKSQGTETKVKAELRIPKLSQNTREQVNEKEQSNQKPLHLNNKTLNVAQIKPKDQLQHKDIQKTTPTVHNTNNEDKKGSKDIFKEVNAPKNKQIFKDDGQELGVGKQPEQTTVNDLKQTAKFEKPNDMIKTINSENTKLAENKQELHQKNADKRNEINNKEEGQKLTAPLNDPIQTDNTDKQNEIIKSQFESSVKPEQISRKKLVREDLQKIQSKDDNAPIDKQEFQKGGNQIQATVDDPKETAKSDKQNREIIKKQLQNASASSVIAEFINKKKSVRKEELQKIQTKNEKTPIEKQEFRKEGNKIQATAHDSKVTAKSDKQNDADVIKKPSQNTGVPSILSEVSSIKKQEKREDNHLQRKEMKENNGSINKVALEEKRFEALQDEPEKAKYVDNTTKSKDPIEAKLEQKETKLEQKETTKEDNRGRAEKDDRNDTIMDGKINNVGERFKIINQTALQDEKPTYFVQNKEKVYKPISKDELKEPHVKNDTQLIKEFNEKEKILLEELQQNIQYKKLATSINKNKPTDIQELQENKQVLANRTQPGRNSRKPTADIHKTNNQDDVINESLRSTSESNLKKRSTTHSTVKTRSKSELRKSTQLENNEETPLPVQNQQPKLKAKIMTVYDKDVQPQPTSKGNFHKFEKLLNESNLKKPRKTAIFKTEKGTKYIAPVPNIIDTEDFPRKCVITPKAVKEMRKKVAEVNQAAKYIEMQRKLREMETLSKGERRLRKYKSQSKIIPPSVGETTFGIEATKRNRYEKLRAQSEAALNKDKEQNKTLESENLDADENIQETKINESNRMEPILTKSSHLDDTRKPTVINLNKSKEAKPKVTDDKNKSNEPGECLESPKSHVPLSNRSNATIITPLKKMTKEELKVRADIAEKYRSGEYKSLKGTSENAEDSTTEETPLRKDILLGIPEKEKRVSAKEPKDSGKKSKDKDHKFASNIDKAKIKEPTNIIKDKRELKTIITPDQTQKWWESVEEIQKSDKIVNDQDIISNLMQSKIIDKEFKEESVLNPTVVESLDYNTPKASVKLVVQNIEGTNKLAFSSDALKVYKQPDIASQLLEYVKTSKNKLKEEVPRTDQRHQVVWGFTEAKSSSQSVPSKTETKQDLLHASKLETSTVNKKQPSSQKEQLQNSGSNKSTKTHTESDYPTQPDTVQKESNKLAIHYKPKGSNKSTKTHTESDHPTQPDTVQNAPNKLAIDYKPKEIKINHDNLKHLQKQSNEHEKIALINSKKSIESQMTAKTSRSIKVNLPSSRSKELEKSAANRAIEDKQLEAVGNKLKGKSDATSKPKSNMQSKKQKYKTNSNRQLTDISKRPATPKVETTQKDATSFAKSENSKTVDTSPKLTNEIRLKSKELDTNKSMEEKKVVISKTNQQYKEKDDATKKTEPIPKSNLQEIDAKSKVSIDQKKSDLSKSNDTQSMLEAPVGMDFITQTLQKASKLQLDTTQEYNKFSVGGSNYQFNQADKEKERKVDPKQSQAAVTIKPKKDFKLNEAVESFINRGKTETDVTKNNEQETTISLYKTQTVTTREISPREVFENIVKTIQHAMKLSMVTLRQYNKIIVCSSHDVDTKKKYGGGNNTAIVNPYTGIYIQKAITPTILGKSERGSCKTLPNFHPQLVVPTKSPCDTMLVEEHRDQPPNSMLCRPIGDKVMKAPRLMLYKAVPSNKYANLRTTYITIKEKPRRSDVSLPVIVAKRRERDANKFTEKELQVLIMKFNLLKKMWIEFKEEEIGEKRYSNFENVCKYSESVTKEAKEKQELKNTLQRDIRLKPHLKPSFDRIVKYYAYIMGESSKPVKTKKSATMIVSPVCERDNTQPKDKRKMSTYTNLNIEDNERN